ncbi:MAG: peptidoglycan D,D-transpeptidase FtsI family protein, partial [Spirulina sp.]
MKVTPLRPRNKPSVDSSKTVPPTPKTHKPSRESQPTPLKLGNARLLLVWGILLVGMGGLGFNLYRLQVSSADRLANKAQQQQQVYMRPYVPRRPIVDRNGNVLASDRLVYTLYAHPNQFKGSRGEVADKLAPLLDRDRRKLLARLDKYQSGLRLAQTLPEETANKITALKLDGLELIRQYSRLYPQQELVSEVVGYVDLDHQGQAGLEYTQQDLLEPKIRTLRLRRAGNGALVPDPLSEGFIDFDDKHLQLTLDMRLQRVVRSLLKESLAKYQAKRGTIIVMDVRDGSLLALACEPTFDPNKYSKYPVSLFKSWAVTDLYEPGSTFKPINIAIALELGVINANSVFNDRGKMQIEHWEIKNHDYDRVGRRGSLDLIRVLQHSSNTGMVDLVQRMNVRQYHQALMDLGITQRAGIELPGEGAGQLKDLKKFLASPVEAATTSFGQGFSLTPLKLAQLHAAIANGGQLVRPHLIRAWVDSQGKSIAHPDPRPLKTVFSEETSRIVLEKMAASTRRSGANMNIRGYPIAGKSGTAPVSYT